MSRSLVLGNGNTLICYDKYGQVKDFYFPYVGSENHVGESCVHKIGVSIDGSFDWLDSSAWEVKVGYKGHTLSSLITARHNSNDIILEFCDVVCNEQDIFIREITISNDSSDNREVKVFLNQQFYIYGTSRGDTAYFEPNRNILVHYEGRRVFVASAMVDGKLFDEYSVGIFGDEGKEGTWRDAEDSCLEKNSIEHGVVDSVLGVAATIPAKSSKKIYYWMTVATKFKDAVALHEEVLRKKPQSLIKSTQKFWNAWANKADIDFYDLDEKIIDLYKKSLLVIRTHVGNNGSIIASGDSDMPRGGRDTYAYVWPRDAAFIATALDGAGCFDTARKFFEFCNDTIGSEGYFFHKYRPDKSLGSSWHPWIKNGIKQLPIQEDETALIIYALWNHYEKCLDLEFIESVYDSLIKKAADFMYGYVEKKTGLPLGSYDIWEEKFGTATFTASSVYAGLRAAGKFAKLLGKDKDAEKYEKQSLNIKKAILEHLYNKDSKFFHRMLDRTGGEAVIDKTLDVSSFLGIFRFEVLDVADEKMRDIFDIVENELYSKSNIGGIIRYKGDRYFQVDEVNTENPWFISTLWGAQYRIARAVDINELKTSLQYLDWSVSYALPSGMLSEQLNRNTGEQLSVAPLIWSHAEFVLTVLQYLEKYTKLKSKI